MFKKYINKNHLSIGLTFLIFATLSILIFMFFSNFSAIVKNINKLLEIFSPIIMGFATAYLLLPILNFFEILFLKIPFLKKRKKFVRAISVTLTISILIIAITIAIISIVPQIIFSLGKIITDIPNYIDNLNTYVYNIFSKNPKLVKLADKQIDFLKDYAVDFANQYKPYLNVLAKQLTMGLLELLVGLQNFAIGIVISVYVLFNKEKLCAQSKKFLYALTPKRFALKSIEITNDTHKIFGEYFNGKVISSIIVGFLTFVFMQLSGMPYAVLISVIIGVTNMIPFFGPFIGAIPSALLLLVINPIQTLWFLIFNLILQQVEGNFISPKIISASTGISAFWVILVIIVSGGLFGIVGMLIGVPIFAVANTLLHRYINKKLETKNLPTENEFYITEKNKPREKKWKY